MLTASLRRTLPLKPLSALRKLANPIVQLKAALLLVIMCASGYGCFIVGQYIEQLFANKEAAAIALYMDSFVEPKVQELSAQPFLSSDARNALEQILSPTSLGRPIVSFKIWVSDQIVSSSRASLITKSFVPTPARTSALEGHVVATYGIDNAADAADERALEVPLLAVYAPVRQSGTSKIIAVAETTHLAVNLSREIETAQRTAYVAIAGSGISLILLVFRIIAMAGARVRTLADKRTGGAPDVREVCVASSKALEYADRKLCDIRSQLHAGALQQLSLILLRLDTIGEGTAQAFRKDTACLRESLQHCIKGIKGVSAGFSPLQLQSMTLVETIAAGALFYAQAEIRSELQNLPQDAPLAVKTSIYQLFLETSACLSKRTAATILHIRAHQKYGRLFIELLFDLTHPQIWRAAEIERRCCDLKHRMEALGGSLQVAAQGDERLLVAATFWCVEV